jgi:hypothetical protein
VREQRCGRRSGHVAHNCLYCTTLYVMAQAAGRGSRAPHRDGVSALLRQYDHSGRDLVLIHRHDLDRSHAINE